MLETAKTYLKNGLSVLPADKKEKYPVGIQWQDYQKKLPDESEIESWFKQAWDGLSIVCGQVSGNLEAIDFDNGGELFKAWAEQIDQELFNRLVIEQSQSGGFHVIYRCECKVDHSEKLAEREKPKGKPLTLIETRGEAGLIVCTPTDGYKFIHNDFSKLPVLTADEREILLNAARSLNEFYTIAEEPKYPSKQYDGLRPGDDFNQKGDISEILRNHDWKFFKENSKHEFWCRPGKEKPGCSATLWKKEKLLYVFSTNAFPFEPNKAYKPFAVYTMLECGGDWTEAARRLRTEGYGDQHPLKVQKGQDADISKIIAKSTRDLTEQEKKDFRNNYQIDISALEKFKPLFNTKDDCVVLPLSSPDKPKKTCGYIRCSLDGKPISIASGGIAKDPLLAGSKHGLLGIEWLYGEDPDTIIFCQTWCDALAAISCGTHATATSGGPFTWDNEWLSLFKNKKVYICMNRDDAGIKAAFIAAIKLTTVTEEVYVVNLPCEIIGKPAKSFHDYLKVQENRNGFCDLLSETEKYESDYPGMHINTIILPSNYSDTVAKGFLKSSDVKYRYNIIDAWSVFSQGKYSAIEEEEVDKRIRKFLESSYWIKEKKDELFLVRINPTNSTVKNILGSLSALTGVHIPPELNAPASLTAKHDPENIIAMNNCLIDISGDVHVTMDLTEDFYTLNYLPYDYDPTAECPRWIEFLEQIFTKNKLEYDIETEELIETDETEPDKIAAMVLQEMFGYLITPWTHLQKIFGLLGPKRSGKSTIGKVITEIVGPKNIAPSSITSLSTNFGLQALIKKSVVIMGDSNISGKSSVIVRAVELLKGISGEDAQQIDRKNKTQVIVDKMPNRFVIIANEIQELEDSSGALASRFNYLETTESFYGREKHNLKKELLAELPGIFNWALKGLFRLKKNGHILEHPKSVEIRGDQEASGSQILAFINEWSVVGPDHFVPVDAYYKAYRDWLKSNKRNDGYSEGVFGRKLKNCGKGIKKHRKRKKNLPDIHLEYDMEETDSPRINFYTGIDLKEDYKKRSNIGDSPWQQ